MLNKSTIFTLLICAILSAFILLYAFNSRVSTKVERYKLYALSYPNTCHDKKNDSYTVCIPRTNFYFHQNIYIVITANKIFINGGRIATYEIIKTETIQGKKKYHIGNVNVNLKEDMWGDMIENNEFIIPNNTVLYMNERNILTSSDNSISFELTKLN